MEGNRGTGSVQLEREASSLLSRWGSDLVGPLDALLADCAAEAVRLTVECLRAERRLNEALESEAASRTAANSSRELFLQRKRLTGELSHLEGLMGSLRLHRGRVASHDPGRR